MTTGQLFILIGTNLAGILVAALMIFSFVRTNSEKQQKMLADELSRNRTENTAAMRAGMEGVTGALMQSQRAASDIQDKRLIELTQQLKNSQDALQKAVNESLLRMDDRMKLLSDRNEQKLEQMRQTVDEKLQKTLEERLGQSFKLVSERLEQVSKGLGEMQSLASGVGDLKKVLSNVKTRGVLGEVQLGAIIDDFLTQDQYEREVTTKPDSRDHVEFAVKLPADDGSPIWLPIDSKFPGDTYAALCDAYETGDKAVVDAAAKQLINTIKAEAKDIRDKYVCPPHTTDYGILFLPFEGLYAEAVKQGMIEILQRDYRVMIAGPSTMAALLNSLQMAFRSFAIQKRSGDVWKVLGAVKTEFEKFADVLENTRTRLRQADSELEKLVGTRTNVMRQKLRSVEQLDGVDAVQVLGLETPDESETEEE
ncbi:MAG TPA: DNA recombination protein RmuC [Oscillospiraceae bacterium]|nr:DNA recombination protein RmuC [Oscillospiraceae bacterium]HPK35788.1 DNA recombination protein RmuC [Oscillospiraceae bacterium]HPR75408.1 DNA recombination protein RmuC [Oscillospiraceae bacterium]